MSQAEPWGKKQWTGACLNAQPAQPAQPAPLPPWRSRWAAKAPSGGCPAPPRPAPPYSLGLKVTLTLLGGTRKPLILIEGILFFPFLFFFLNQGSRAWSPGFRAGSLSSFGNILLVGRRIEGVCCQKLRTWTSGPSEDWKGNGGGEGGQERGELMLRAWNFALVEGKE